MERKKAFTLIELLVVISIIALLLSVLMPALSRAKSTARRVVCGGDIRQVIASIVMAAQGTQNGTLTLAGMPSYDLDDNISMEIEGYFNIGSAFAKIPGGYTESEIWKIPPTKGCGELQGGSAIQAKIRAITDKLDQSGFKKIFNCPEQALKVKDTDYWQRTTPHPVVQMLGQTWIVRLGYSYTGGFRTNTNDTIIQPGSSVAWRSPKTLNDPGYLTVMTDTARSIPGPFPWSAGGNSYSFGANHGKYGFVGRTIRFAEDVRKTFPDTYTNVGTFDGAVQALKLPSTKPHQMTWQPANVAVGVDYNFW